MGRGSSASGGRASGGGGVDPSNIKGQEDMISARNEENREGIDRTLDVARNMTKEFGNNVALEGNFQLASFVGKDATTLGCYDAGGNIIMNKNVINSKRLNEVYDSNVKSGYHPSRGNKSAVEAVAAHEYGHSLTENARKGMGGNLTYDQAATRIVTEARKQTGSKGNIKFGRKISEYATTSNAETVAEAVSDWYCNGSKAKRESKAVVKVLKGYIKK